MTEAGQGVSGLHHASAICGDPQRNVDFVVGLLGLRLVKKTVNFDDPGTYHLYYGDRSGTPGTIMTYFAWIGAPPLTPVTGRQGAGQIVATSFSIPPTALDYWVDRLAAASVDFDGPEVRFGERVLRFADPDGLPLELIAGSDVPAPEVWEESTVPPAHAIAGLGPVTVCVNGYDATAALLTEVFGFRYVGREGERFRLARGVAERRATVDLVVRPEAAPGRMGIGVTHHIAWRTSEAETQGEWREALSAVGLDVTPILDRTYFQSIYFQEAAGVLFEIATDGPGFRVDESEEGLGTELKLPAWLEPQRERIEAKLPRIRPARKRKW